MTFSTKIRTVAALVVGLTLACAIQAAEPKTELGKRAAGMKPGTWAELKTDGYTVDLLKVQDHHILEYTAAAIWDPTSRQVLFVGQRWQK
jgi:hypothetical protein